MTPAISKKLFERYDYLFRDAETGKLNGLMGFGFSCGDGWYNILDCLFEELCSDVVSLQVDEMYTRRQIEKAKEFINSPRMSDSQRERRKALERKARKAEMAGDFESATECRLNIEMLDEALQRLADEEFKRYQSLQEDLKKLEIEIAEAKTKAPRVSQVKEKFATLCVYGSFPDNKWAAVRLAERLSGRICEECGAPGKRVIIEHIHATLCMPHANQRAKGRPMQIFGLDRP